MIKALIFDLGGVLFDYRPDVRLAAFAGATGLEPQTIHKRLFASGYSETCDRGRHNHESAFREGLKLLGVRMTRQHFGDLWSSAFVPNTAVIDLAAHYRSCFTLALLTNNSKLVKAELLQRHPDVFDLFRPQMFSADVGYLKPDPKIFQTLLSMMNLTPEEALFIDDGRANVDGAAALGLAVHHFHGSDELARLLETLQ